MTNDILEMIQAEIDGQNSPEASNKLAERCRLDPAVQKEMDEARAIANALDTLSDARLPDGFSARVMNSLPDEPAWARHRRQAPASARSSIRMSRRPWLNLAYGLVVGVFVTFAAMSTLQPDRGAIEGMGGTMMITDAHPVIERSIAIADDHIVEVSVWEDESGISTRIEGELPEGSTPSIIIELVDGRQVTIPIHKP